MKSQLRAWLLEIELAQPAELEQPGLSRRQVLEARQCELLSSPRSRKIRIRLSFSSLFKPLNPKTANLPLKPEASSHSHTNLHVFPISQLSGEHGFSEMIRAGQVKTSIAQ
jgi:hypothetical protein